MDEIKELMRLCNFEPIKTPEQMNALDDSGTSVMIRIVQNLRKMIEASTSRLGINVNPGIIMFLILGNLDEIQDMLLEQFGIGYTYGNDFDTITIGGVTKQVCITVTNGELRVTNKKENGMLFYFSAFASKPDSVEMDMYFVSRKENLQLQREGLFVKFWENGLWKEQGQHNDLKQETSGKFKSQESILEISSSNGNLTFREINCLNENPSDTTSKEILTRPASEFEIAYPAEPRWYLSPKDGSIIDYSAVLASAFPEIYTAAKAIYQSEKNR